MSTRPPRRVLGLALALVLAACGGQQAPWAEAPPVAIDLVAHLGAERVPLLGTVELTLDLFRRQDLEVDFDPQVPAGCTGTVELAPERELGNGRWRHARLTLRPIQGPGKLTIAPFKATAKDGTVSASTPELALDVTSLLADAGAELEAPGAPMLPAGPLWPWLAGGAAAALAALYLIRRSRRARTMPRAPVAVPVPAHVKALRELMRLRAVARRTAGEIEAFYVATSQVLRVYLEERFGLHAPERTTEEFLLEIEAGGPLSAAQCLEVRRFLQQCDLVKFAALVPGEELHMQTLAIAELLVESTRPDRAPLGASA